MISVLSLVVAILAVFFGPLVAWSVSRQQIAGAARESWLREFREQVAALLAGEQALAQHRRDNAGPEEAQREAEIKHALRSAYHTIRLLLAERPAALYEPFVHALGRFMRPDANDEDVDSLAFWAEHVMRIERLGISWDPRVWTALRSSLGLYGAVARARQLRPWSRLVTWLGRDPPRFPDLP